MTENRAGSTGCRYFLLLAGVAVVAGAVLLVALRPAWRHAVIVTYPGTRSEGSVGILRFEGVVFPPWANTIVTRDRRFFAYKVRQYHWFHGGWQPSKGKVAALQMGNRESFSSECASMGFYRGPVRRGTPRDWLYLPELGVWTDAREATMQRLFALHGWTYTVTMNSDHETEGVLKVHSKPVGATPQHLVTPVGEFEALPASSPDRGWTLVSGRTCMPAPTRLAAKGKLPTTTGVALLPRPPTAADDWCFCPQSSKWLAPEDVTPP